MKIIILGAGRVGYSVAESLVSERNDITVIDTDARRLRELESRFDLRGVVGNGIDPQVLAEAGAKDTDLLIACAALDETNLVCCKLAQVLFEIPTRIARVRSSGFGDDETLLGKEGFGVDRIICPEESLTNYISKLIEFPEAMQVRAFAGGRAALASVRARDGAPAVGKHIGELRDCMPELAMRIVAIYQPAGRPSRPVYRIMIAGGDQVSLRLALQLSRVPGRFHIKIIEPDEQRCQDLASLLPAEVLVLHGDATDEDLLADESVEDVDLFLALTDDDENNIMASLLGKRMGARRVLSLITRRAYADLMHGTQIDIALSPAQAMLGELLAYVRRGDR